MQYLKLSKRLINLKIIFIVFIRFVFEEMDNLSRSNLKVVQGTIASYPLYAPRMLLANFHQVFDTTLELLIKPDYPIICRFK